MQAVEEECSSLNASAASATATAPRWAIHAVLSRSDASSPTPCKKTYVPRIEVLEVDCSRRVRATTRVLCRRKGVASGLRGAKKRLSCLAGMLTGSVARGYSRMLGPLYTRTRPQRGHRATLPNVEVVPLDILGSKGQLFIVGLDRSRPAFPRRFAQELRFARLSGEGTLARCQIHPTFGYFI